MPASNDPASVKEGGLAQKTLGTEKCQIIEFPDMKHGWSVRGDCSKPLVSACVILIIPNLIKSQSLTYKMIIYASAAGGKRCQKSLQRCCGIFQQTSEKLIKYLHSSKNLVYRIRFEVKQLG